MRDFEEGGCRMRNITEGLKEHYDYVCSHTIDADSIVGIFLYGSQNYGLGTENSDIDTKCVVLPSLQDSAFGRGNWAKELHLPNGEHCNVMTIQHYIENLRKCNLNYVETLFTEHCILNPIYGRLFLSDFIGMREAISIYDKTRSIKASRGQVNRYLKEVSKTTYKSLARALFLKEFCEKYMNNEPYEDCIKASEETYKRYMELRSRDDSILRNEDSLSTYYDLKYYFEKLEYKAEASTVLQQHITAVLEESALLMIKLHDEMR